MSSADMNDGGLASNHGSFSDGQPAAADEMQELSFESPLETDLAQA